jgi:hypothetical protein
MYQIKLDKGVVGWEPQGVGDTIAGVALVDSSTLRRRGWSEPEISRLREYVQAGGRVRASEGRAPSSSGSKLQRNTPTRSR